MFDQPQRPCLGVWIGLSLEDLLTEPEGGNENTDTGAVDDGAVLTVTCSGSTRLAVPTNKTAGTANDTSRPYKCIGFVGAAHSPAAPGVCICRDG